MKVEEQIGAAEMPKIDPKKTYAIRVNFVEVEIFKEYDNVNDAERLWKDVRWSRMRDFATVSGSFLIELLQKRKLVNNKEKKK